MTSDAAAVPLDGGGCGEGQFGPNGDAAAMRGSRRSERALFRAIPNRTWKPVGLDSKLGLTFAVVLQSTARGRERR